MASQLEPFSGEEVFQAPPERVFAALTNPETIAAAIPDKVSHERVDERTLKCVVSPGFAFIRANMKLTITVNEARPNTDVAFNIASQGIGASMQVDCVMRIAPEGAAASRVGWEARVGKLGGLIAAVSPALIRGAADKVIRDGWAAMRKQIET
jgi:carbon monoxide dehydrogenase subunit G